MIDKNYVYKGEKSILPQKKKKHIFKHNFYNS